MSFYLIIFSTLLTAVFGFLRYKYSYWETQGVLQLPTHFLFGNLLKLKSIHHTDLLHEVYQKFKGKAQIAGTYIFITPIALVLDLDLAKTILIKDFHKFTDRSDRRNEKESLFTANLFNLQGEKWRNLRVKLTPTFTTAKMKFMYPTIIKVAKEFGLAFEKHVSSAKNVNGVVELHDLMGRYTTDVIGNCAFGIECNSLKDPDVEFRKIGRQIFYPKRISVRWRLFLMTYMKYLKYLGMRRSAPTIEEFIMRIVRDTVSAREKDNIQRNDFINLLIELKNSKDLEGMPGLTIEQVAAQVFIFFVAGFETSSSNMSYGIFELAKNPAVQEKLRVEILRVLEKYNGELTYEAMMEMKYLDQVITETLRKYPALAALTRVAQEDYNVPGTDIIIEKGIDVYIPTKEIHYDPEVYDNPKEFRPERFDPEEVQKRHTQAFLGFGDGPRNCIGLRFGRMQVRVGLITLLKSFKFSVSEKTPDELQISNYSFVLVPDGGVWVKAEKL